MVRNQPSSNVNRHTTIAHLSFTLCTDTALMIKTLQQSHLIKIFMNGTVLYEIIHYMNIFMIFMIYNRNIQKNTSIRESSFSDITCNLQSVKIHVVKIFWTTLYFSKYDTLLMETEWLKTKMYFLNYYITTLVININETQPREFFPLNPNVGQNILPSGVLNFRFSIIKYSS